jgi:hypothetical protein
MAARLHSSLRLPMTMSWPSKQVCHNTALFSYPHRALSFPLPSHNTLSVVHNSSCSISLPQATAIHTVGSTAAVRLQHGACNSTRSIRCFAAKAAKAKIKFCCESCGHDSFQFFGKCPTCDEFGTCEILRHSYLATGVLPMLHCRM